MEYLNPIFLYDSISKESDSLLQCTAAVVISITIILSVPSSSVVQMMGLVVMPSPTLVNARTWML